MSNYENLLPSSKTFSCSWWGMIKKIKIRTCKIKDKTWSESFCDKLQLGRSSNNLKVSSWIIWRAFIVKGTGSSTFSFFFAHVGHICWRAVCRTSCSGSFFPSLVASSSLRVSEGESSGARRSSHIRWCSLTVQSEHSNTNVNFAAVYLEL